jgi:hypothetical protein
MTAIATPTVVPARRRIALATRLHATNPWGTLILPWLILIGVFGVNFAVWHIVKAAAGDGQVDPDAFQYNGGVTWIFFYMAVVAIQAMNQTFRFALGMSATRRDYYLGTALYFVALSLMYGIGISLLAAIERATDGWGVRGAFFAPAFMADLPLAQVAFGFVLILLLLFFVGAAVATVFVRWGSNGILAFFGAVAVIGLAGAWLMTRANAWGSLVDALGGHSFVWIVSWSLIPTVVAGGVGFMLLRRATPRS